MSGALAEPGLERLAEQRGDVTLEVLERFYRAFPHARASFVHHGLDDTAGLEGRMVAETAYLLLQWSENPLEAQIDHGTALAHHHDTLKVGPQWYLGMVDAFLSVLLETVPDDASAERAHWQRVRSEIVAFFSEVRGEFVTADREPALPERLDPARYC